jgi:fluoride exporter
MWAYFWIALGGALGSMARFWLSGVLASRYGEAFPWGTLAVNVTGSVAIGFLAGISEPCGKLALPSGARHLATAGFCGGYTTFSAFSLQTFHMLRDGEWLQAGGNVLLSILACIAGVWLGYFLGSMLRAGKAG